MRKNFLHKEVKQHRSIRTKLVLILSLTAFIAILLSSIVQFWYSYNANKENAINNLSQTVSILGENLSASLEFDDSESASLILSALKLSEGIEAAYILRSKDDIFASYLKDGVAEANLKKKAFTLYETNDIKKRIDFSDFDTIIVSEPINDEGQYLASFIVVSNTKSLNEMLKNQLISQAIISLAVAVFIVFFALIIQRGFTLPIFSLKNAMDDVRENHNYDAKIDFKSNDEFQSLFDGFYKMIETIKSQKEEQKKAQKEIKYQKDFNETLLNSQEQLIVTTDDKKLLTANETFYDFFAVDSVEDFMNKYNCKCVCDTFNINAPEAYLQKMMGRESWIDYVISHSFGETHKVMITMGTTDFIFSVSATQLPGEKGLKSAVFTDITEMENAKQEVEAIHKQTRASIEYASMIQGALLPDKQLLGNYFKDYFAYWMPKDTVGGDIWLFEELRHKDECLLFFIDCTGHGVPGAFVTMIVKAIEREIVAKIMKDKEIDVSPAWIMSYFNKSMKALLKQETKDSKSNAGWDGGIIYYNKRDQVLKFAGAETPLFYIDENQEFQTIKGNRYSVGYKKCSMDYEYKESIINVQEGMKFYCTTDGFLDQNGGAKDFPFGKKRFGNIIRENHAKPMEIQEEIFVNTMDEYENIMAENCDRNDDMTLIAFEIEGD